MKLRSAAACTLALLLATACSSSSGDGSGVDGGAEAADDDATRGSGAAQTSVHQTVAVADSMFDFDPTIDPTKTAEANAQAIAANTTKTAGGCAKVTVNGASLTVAFGPPPGCTLASGIVVSGSVTASVTKTDGTTTVALTFDTFVANGTSLGGKATFATTNGSTFATDVALTSGASTYTGKVTILGGSGTFTISGNIDAVQGSTTTAVTFASLSYRLGDCYPAGGSMTVTRASQTQKVTFDANTPTTGTVTVTVGRRSYPAQLPAYGNCPGQGWSTTSRDAGRG
jgi:hypothetical protein